MGYTNVARLSYPCVDTAYTLTVNGKQATVDAQADMPLLWALRDLLNLKGTKYGCGIGACGACTLHIDGKPARACQTRVSAARGRAITTIEGLSADGSCATYLRIREARSSPGAAIS